MYEAYEYIDNVSEEICQLLECILKKDQKNIAKYHKQMFYQNVMKNHQDLIEYIILNKSESYPEKQIYKKYRKFELQEKQEKYEKARILVCENIENDIFDTASTNSFEKDSFENVNFFSIDQVVNYIEGKSTNNRRKKKKNKSSAKNSLNSLQINELDIEVQEFEKTLNLIPVKSRSKLILSEDFLQELRNKIQPYR